MKLTPVMHRYIVHWGDGRPRGINPLGRADHARCTSPNPLHADEIAETFRHRALQREHGAKEPLAWELIHVTSTLGDRRDFFVSQDPGNHPRDRRRAEASRDGSHARLPREAVERAEDRQGNAARSTRAHRRPARTHGDAAKWYDSIKGLPRKTLLKMMRLGHTISKVIGE